LALVPDEDLFAIHGGTRDGQTMIHNSTIRGDAIYDCFGK
jgi:hypothetical protein